MERAEVFLLEHARENKDGSQDVKTIGIYSTRDAAQAAIERLKIQPGFRNTPEGFTCDRYWLDQDHWEDGYTAIAPMDTDE